MASPSIPLRLLKTIWPLRGRGGAVSDGGGAISGAEPVPAAGEAISGGNGSGKELDDLLVRASGSAFGSDGAWVLVEFACGVTVGS